MMEALHNTTVVYAKLSNDKFYYMVQYTLVWESAVCTLIFYSMQYKGSLFKKNYRSSFMAYIEITIKLYEVTIYHSKN